MNRTARNIVLAVLVAAAFFGYRFYQKGSAKKELQAQLIEVCGPDTACTAAVDEHFDDCFEHSYRIGGRRRGASFDSQGMVACINSAAGADHFAFDPDAEADGG